MPELPEVERGRRIAESIAAGRAITACRCADDRIVIDGVTPRTLARTLKDRRVEAVNRRGKQLWFTLDQPPHPLFHFGMTGQFLVRGQAPIHYRSSPKTGEDVAAWPPKWWKIHLTFDNGGELVMTNKRRLGRIRLRDDPEHEPPISELGFDPLIDLPAPKQFAIQLCSRKAPIKAVLMDQSLAAGVGNWIADEILYQARIDPRRRACELDDAEAKRIRAKLKLICEKAVNVDADKSRLPKNWLFHHRWGRNSEAASAKGERIEHMTIGGRTTAWVPSVQR